MAEQKNSPLKILPVIGAALSAGSSIYGAVQAGKAQKAAEKPRLKKKKLELKWIDLEMCMLILILVIHL